MNDKDRKNVDGAKLEILEQLKLDEIDWSYVALLAGGANEIYRSEKEEKAKTEGYTGLTSTFVLDGTDREVGVYRDMEGDGGFYLFFRNGETKTAFPLSQEAGQCTLMGLVGLFATQNVEQIPRCKCGSRKLSALEKTHRGIHFFYVSCADCKREGTPVPVGQDMIKATHEALQVFQMQMDEEE